MKRKSYICKRLFHDINTDDKEMKWFNMLYVTAVVLLLCVSCTQTTGVEEIKPTRDEAFYDISDFSELCKTYEGLFCDFQYPNQIPVQEVIDMSRFTSQQTKEFERILTYGNDLDKVKYIAENELLYGEGIVFNEYAPGPGVNQISVNYSNDSTSVDYEFSRFLDEAKNDKETILYKNMGTDYAMVRSRDDELGIFKMRFVALGEHNESIIGELIYDVNQEADFKKLEPFIIKSIQFK